MHANQETIVGLLQSLSATAPADSIRVEREAELKMLAREILDLLGEPSASALAFSIRSAGAARKAARSRAAKREANRVRSTLRLIKGGLS